MKRKIKKATRRVASPCFYVLRTESTGILKYTHLIKKCKLKTEAESKLEEAIEKESFVGYKLSNIVKVTYTIKNQNKEVVTTIILNK